MTSRDSGSVDGSDVIEVLDASDVDRLRLGWWSRIDAAEARGLLASAPGHSLWMPTSHEYILVGPWRRRAEIAHVVDLAAVRHSVELARAAVDRARDAGDRLFLTVEMSERRQGSFYQRVGLELLETVISYEVATRRGRELRVADPDIRRIDDLGGTTLEELIHVDWDAFPWLWRNSEAEFQQYFAQPGVELFMLREGSVAIGYVGITVFPGWGHIDRLAVVTREQGKRWGRILTEFAINRLLALGAVRVGLSTQLRNERSQGLYTRLGFRRQVAGDYRIYGRALCQNDSIDDLVMGNT